MDKQLQDDPWMGYLNEPRDIAEERFEDELLLEQTVRWGAPSHAHCDQVEPPVVNPNPTSLERLRTALLTEAWKMNQRYGVCPMWLRLWLR